MSVRISSKGRYALASVITMAQQYSGGENVTVISISGKLGISKIYLEQVFSLLKRGGLVDSVKGAQGGYQLTRAPALISVLDVLSAVDSALFEKTEETVREKAPDIDTAMQSSVFDVLDSSVTETLHKITLSDLVSDAERQKADGALMFYI
jgi:Rrf2 family cysteine metabolism transcriptional repressor